tara:strand:+ start:743 stop:1033 length:291 start_codon:yes stop_codon:yes gene_type:complete
LPALFIEKLKEARMKISKSQLRRIIKEEKAKLFKEDAGIAGYYKSKQKAVSEVQKEIEAAYRVLKTLDRSSREYSDQKMVIAALEDKRLHVGYTGD